MGKFITAQGDKENILKEKTDKLLYYKHLGKKRKQKYLFLTEKISFKLCKKNESLSNNLDTFEKNRENLQKIIERLSSREDKIYHKIYKENQSSSKYLANGLEHSVYFRKIIIF